jgi:hypothetical protein
MAATNYTPIYIYNSGTTTSVPTNTNLGAGELAINYTDGKLFYKDNSNVVQVIATKASAAITLPVSAANGGTGVSNGANNTITFTGNYTLGLTLTANTALTLPTSGTLVNTGKSIAMAMIFGF